MNHEIRRRKIFPKDASSSTSQKDLSMYTRIGMIDQVNPLEGTCTIKWLDRPGRRYDVLLTQGSPNEWCIPKRGDCVLVAFDHHERARIIRYINVGHAARIKDSKSLPKLKDGEKLWEVEGSYLYLKKGGDIVLSTLDKGYIVLEANTGTWKSETVSWKIITEAGIMNFGLIKRFVSDGTQREYQEIVDEEGNNYTEFRIKIAEQADGILGVSGLEDPFIDIALGTYVDADGKAVNKKGEEGDYNKQLVVKISLKNGVQISIDKEGRVSLKATSWNFNEASVDIDDPDIEKELEINNESKGLKGQHAAREHDEITIPLSTDYSDDEHLGLSLKSASNLASLTILAGAIMSPSGPCTLNPALLTGNINLKGEITAGAKNLLIGDD